MSANANPKGGARMGYRRGEGRHQTDGLPEAIDDDIGAANPARFWDAVVEQLDREP